MESTVDVVRTYLELRTPAQLRPARADDASLRVERAASCTPSYYRYLYGEVGRAHHWRDRSRWSDDQLRAHLARDDVSVWVLSRGGTPAGWFELVRQQDGSVEIAYFGLLPDFIGHGLGKHLLTEAAEHAWRLGAARVWLHTCTLDSPAALPNYLARGFAPYRKERYTTTLA
jgi:GNAT superfamily N-acetyltransferase